MLPLQDFKDYIHNNELFSANQKVLLAVSGGKDSVLMAHLFKQAGYNFGIAHCNFNLRGAESGRDEDFVCTLASGLGVPFHVTHFDTKNYAATYKVSTQMAARTLRYNWFEEIRNACGYIYIALAQHQDDVVETVLLNLTRGTGIAGLHGILPKRDKLVRPLLFLSRSRIDELIAAGQLDYVEDSSNQHTDYARNKIRHDVVPQLKAINPRLVLTFQQNAGRFAEAEQVLQNVVAALRKELFSTSVTIQYIALEKIRQLSPKQLLTFELFRPYGFSESVIADLLRSLDRQSGALFYSNTHCILIDRDQLILYQPGEVYRQQLRFIHPHDELILLPGHQLKISYAEQPFFERVPAKAFVDAGKLIYPLMIRNREPGDKFKPIGMNTFRKLSDFFIDLKIPVVDKDTIPVIVNGNGEIIWLAGLRQDDRYKITGDTGRIVILELVPVSGEGDKPANYIPSTGIK